MSPESEEHALLWCPMHKEARRHLLRTTGWPRGETQLVADDAVKWTVPDAAQAQCAEEVLATAVQELSQAMAWTRNSRKE